MTDTPTRRRAPGMSPERRREMIIAAALPLVAEFGATVTTSQIARAAGIGEATIFRAFRDKEELMDACLAEAVRPDHAVTEITSIPLDQPLADRLVEAAEALSAHLDRMGATIGALHTSGHRSGDRRRERPVAGAGEAAPGASREASITAIREAVTDLFEPDRETLRLPAEEAAAIFLGLLFMRPRSGGSPQPSTEAIVQVFLYGALTDGTGAATTTATGGDQTPGGR
ncbi:TetR/AcrR family transcriptional regulator [Actinopolymorpha pittospori]